MSHKVSFAAQLSGVKSRKDRTFRVELDTQELGEDAAKLFALLGSQGWALFSPNDDITEEDIPEVRADAALDDKSPSQRLRAVLFVYWKQRGQKEPWEVFYTSHMERLIERVKDQLEPKGD